MRGSSYSHLYFCWIVAREGTVTGVPEVLHVTPQTISSQLKVLEDSLGARLFARSGRKLALTDTGPLALTFAEEIFRPRSEMTEALKGRSSGRPIQFSVGQMTAAAVSSRTIRGTTLGPAATTPPWRLASERPGARR